MNAVVEPLATLIGGRQALSTAAGLIEKAGGFEALSQLGCAALRKLGLPPRTAERVAGAFALGRARVEPKIDRQAISGPEDVVRLLRPKYGRLETERFGALLLDARNRVLEVCEVAQGAVNCVVTPGANVFRQAIRIAAANVIAFHNHPSGDAAPSPEDISVTKRLLALGEQLGITVLDHIIIARDEWCSIRDRSAHLFTEKAITHIWPKAAGADR